MDIIVSFLFIAVAIIITYFGYMLPFMGVVFIILAGLKLLDIKGFSDIFKTYDLVAKRFPVYATVYPFIELALGFCFLFKFLLPIAAVITLIIMTIGTISLIKHLKSKKRKACACLGAKFRIPLTRFTLVEDIVMGVMALLILI